MRFIWNSGQRGVVSLTVVDLKVVDNDLAAVTVIKSSIVPQKLYSCGGMVYLIVVNEDTPGAGAVDVLVVVAIMVLTDDVITVVVETEPKNGNCRHQSPDDEFDVAAVGRMELVTDDG